MHFSKPMSLNELDHYRLNQTKVAKKSALIVDDQPDIRRLIVMTMEIGDFELHETSNGDNAWRLAVEIQPSVVVLDAMIPGSLNGFEVCRRIKDHDVLKLTTKVVLLTAMSQKTDLNRGLAAGCDAYLIKPFSPIELLDTVDRLVAAD
jgi:DNA-binding response OmpR family regulator